MSLQNATDKRISATPFDVNRAKHADPNRNPSVTVDAVVAKERDNQMKDCPDTTVLMRLRQFQEVELYNLAADFDKVHALKKKGHRSDKAIDKTGHDLDNTHTLDANHHLDKTGLHSLDDSHTLDATHETDKTDLNVDANHNTDDTGHNLDDTGHEVHYTYDSKSLPYVNQVWWAFHDAVGSMPKGANLKDATWDKLSEKDLSKAWVRGFDVAHQF